jgi:hypothetical protein
LIYKIEVMKWPGLVLLLSLFPILGYAQSANGVLRFESEGFNINADGFNVKRSDIGSVAVKARRSYYSSNLPEGSLQMLTY